MPTPNYHTGGGGSAGNIFNIVTQSAGVQSGGSGGAGSNYPPGGVVIGNPNPTNLLLGKYKLSAAH